MSQVNEDCHNYTVSLCYSLSMKFNAFCFHFAGEALSWKQKVPNSLNVKFRRFI